MDSKYYNSDLIITIVSLAIEEINRKALMSALNNYHIC